MNKFLVYPDNNPKVIREALLKRGNWEEVFAIALSSVK